MRVYLIQSNGGFKVTQENCLRPVATVPQPYYVNYILNLGGRIVQTDSGLKIAFATDPIRINPFLRRTNPDDIVVATPKGIVVLPASAQKTLPPDWAEIFLPLPSQIKNCF